MCLHRGLDSPSVVFAGFRRAATHRERRCAAPRACVRARALACWEPVGLIRCQRADTGEQKRWWSRALACFKSLVALALVCLRFFDQNREKMKTKKPKKTRCLAFCLCRGEFFLCPGSGRAPAQDCGRTSPSKSTVTHGRNCHVAMEANTTRLDRGPRQHKNTVSTEDRVMAAHMRVDHPVGGENNDVAKGLAAPLLCHIARCVLCLVRMRLEQGRAVSRPTFALRLVRRCHDKHHTHTLVYLSLWSFCLTAVA